MHVSALAASGRSAAEEMSHLHVWYAMTPHGLLLSPITRKTRPRVARGGGLVLSRGGRAIGHGPLRPPHIFRLIEMTISSTIPPSSPSP